MLIGIPLATSVVPYSLIFASLKRLILTVDCHGTT
jgi:hypothetical protein